SRIGSAGCFASHASLGAAIRPNWVAMTRSMPQVRMYPSRDFPKRLASRYMLLNGRRRMAVDVTVSRRLLTREEYHRMGEVGILKPSDRVELIEGEIVQMSPIGRRHYAFTDNLTRLLILRLGDRAVGAVPGPIRLRDRTQ